MTGGALFLTGAAITALVIVLPHPPELNEWGYWCLCFAQVAFGVLLFSWSRIDPLSQRWLGPLTIAGAVTAVTAAIYMNGEKDGGPALLNEFFYVWPAMYAGYFFRGRGTIVVVAAITIAYCLVSAAGNIETSTVVIRALITISVVGGSAAVGHILRRYVNALVGRLDELARTDILTSLTNRRGFDERLAQELQRERRTGEPVSLLLGDLDRFKAVNDRFGHGAGDEVLRGVGAVLLDRARGVDTAARIGGEEFALLMPATGGAAAADASERLREAIGTVTAPDGSPIEVSFGVASTESASCFDSDSLLSAADRGLYAAKEMGRNRTVTFEEAERAAAPA